MLFNIGFNESLRYHDFRCFVFHDVDLIPEDDRNYYGCPDAPRHLSVAIDKFQYRYVLFFNMYIHLAQLSVTFDKTHHRYKFESFHPSLLHHIHFRTVRSV